MAQLKWRSRSGPSSITPRALSRGKRASGCDVCGAYPNTPCVRWKVADGVRYKAGTLKTYHKSRGEAKADD